jgi:hypothetical protein
MEIQGKKDTAIGTTIEEFNLFEWGDKRGVGVGGERRGRGRVGEERRRCMELSGEVRFF